MAFREQVTTCVICQVPMSAAQTATGHDFEVCDRCGSAWMDVGAFLADLRKAQPGHHIDELMEHNDGTPRRPCPRCGETMSIVWLEFLQLDQCEPHGVWFDGGELERAFKGDWVPAQVQAALAQAETREAQRRANAHAACHCACGSSWDTFHHHHHHHHH
jgi:Zn-finger nucleic acid-binding protein